MLVKQRQGTSQDVPLGLGTAPWVAALEEIDRFPSSVHAIALCNAAELAGGMMTEVSIPSGARWIPKGMTVEYLAKAKTAIHAIADGSEIDWQTSGDKIVPVEIFDEAGVKVFTARITMNVKIG
ncbi:hotdog fold domain-containing protein [Pseudomonas hefeiensis]|uniref:Hotdog fold domain-containing protein n=1 Tax=Pseudomonas hefeiensis TaxID=2738125 RepID=A0ABY9GIT0_9PSED|nr:MULTISPECIES: hotdog fold domain-containing protein [unclassified Pseudomonas]WLH15509.1 hotdog fold domain-containing protein [Pseudomonas sp. FP205]WLH98553.1 hotdog fold domain-containing protein [Pseudomonas sp. FP53]WLI42815.1 hotdog fold domain-containing protein [Pseudomonas sp. FP821]